MSSVRQAVSGALQPNPTWAEARPICQAEMISLEPTRNKLLSFPTVKALPGSWPQAGSKDAAQEKGKKNPQQTTFICGDARCWPVIALQEMINWANGQNQKINKFVCFFRAYEWFIHSVPLVYKDADSCQTFNIVCVCTTNPVILTAVLRIRKRITVQLWQLETTCAPS